MLSRDKLLVAAGIAVAMLPAHAWAQARTRYQWNTGELRGIRTIGGDFGAYSAGLDRLTAAGAYGGGVLQSSLSSSSGYQLRRFASGAIAGGSGFSSPSLADSSSVQSYAPVGLNLRMQEVDLGATRGLANRAAADPMLGIQSYLEAMGHKTTLQADSDKPITSLVPSEPSVYQEHMEQGDRAFREGKFPESADAFELALTYARYSPEAHLSKLHADFALGHYNAAAYDLERALTYFPELALVPLRVRGFYTRAEQFVEHLENLRKATLQPTAEANAWLLLAYFRYFDDAEAEAASALREAWERNTKVKDEAAQASMAQSLERFWDGMVEAGKAAGSLGASTQPGSPASAPARGAEADAPGSKSRTEQPDE